MRHIPIGQFNDAAIVREATFFTVHARLARWAELLEAIGNRPLVTLMGTEFMARSKRAKLRADGSPISVAFADPLLRFSGLRGDTYGDAKDFFRLSDRQLHRMLCGCHLGVVTSGTLAAGQIRVVQRRRRLSDRIRHYVQQLLIAPENIGVMR